MAEQPTIAVSPDDAPARGVSGLTPRAVLIGLVSTALVDLWLHWAELVLGGRGHTSLATTSIPIGAFDVLFVLVVINLVLQRGLKPFAFSPAELLVIYVMMTVSTVISSTGGIHFVVPTITAAFYYANSSNGWADLFHRFIPGWLAQKDLHALSGFYVGGAAVPWEAWRAQITAWCGLLFLLSLASLCIVVILRKQWIERERLSFPTVAVPVEMVREGEGFFRNRLLWVGFAIPFVIDVMNTVHFNLPLVPYFPTRSTDQPDLLLLLNAPPWNAIGSTPISIYPSVIAVAFLLPVDLTFSCWFFWLLGKAEAVAGAAMGVMAGAASGAQSAWPYIGHQGAGAFMGLTLLGLWASRRYLAEVWRQAWRGARDDREPFSYRLAFIGLGLCFAALTAWCVAAGMRPLVAVALLSLAFIYMIAATRIHAETGNAWLFGPDVDAYQVMTTTFGSSGYHAADLTALAFLRGAIANFDLRCLAMPHQLEAYKMADALGADRRKLTVAMVIAVLLGTVVSFAIALMIWYAFGAGSQTDSWRTYMGRMPFEQLADILKSPTRPDYSGSMAMATGFLVTGALMLLRTRLPGWPLHPVGYAMACTNTMNQVWLPFFFAWLIKKVVLHFGGMRLYRRALPFFYGVILGDFLAGGLTTLIGCFTGINVYPTNW